MANRLAEETSPYLRQHMNNPVQWYPWGDEALSQAQADQKPIIVSIGYSACHWCHVMERESFEDTQVASLMNENFICVKVDREERPDIDAIYMDAAQAMTGHGGWPLNAFLTPEGIPFYTGTYFPPEPRHGLPSWSDVLTVLSQAWRERRAEIEEQAKAILPLLVGVASNGEALRTDGTEEIGVSLDQAIETLHSEYDGSYGGFETAPKFPPHSVLNFLLARGEHTMSLHTLRAMASGGIYDQIGGGFSRYSVDHQWIVPHFEKMLYDNALLARNYLHAWQITREDFFLQICTETLDWAMREMRMEEGGFASALDADSEGVEGKFYVWSIDEIQEILGVQLSKIAVDYFGLTERGNFEGLNIPLKACFYRNPDGSHVVPDELPKIKSALYAHRSKRVWPALDDKRITSWNALMISALAEAGAVLGRQDYLAAAIDCADFIDTKLRDSSGRLLRTYSRGQAKLNAYLEDHAYLLEAFITLYETSFDTRWFEAARRLADSMIDRFSDRENVGLFSTSIDHERLIVRRKEAGDIPIPAETSSAALGLLRLSRLTGDNAYEDLAASIVMPLTELASQRPSAFGYLLRALDFYTSPAKEVAVVGERTENLMNVVRSRFRPNLVIAGGQKQGVPLLKGRTTIDGKPTAYVCERFSCRNPVTDPSELELLLK